MSPTLPLYQSHKQVRAAEIHQVDAKSRRIMVSVPSAADDPNVMAPFTIMVEDSWLEKNEPKPGMWLVEYADGYRSVSPATAFSTGYEAIDEDQANDEWKARDPAQNTSSDVKSPEAVNQGGAGVTNDGR